MIILKILGIIGLIFIAYIAIVLFLGNFILIPLSMLYGQIKARRFWKKERPNTCKQLKAEGFTDEEIELLAPKDFNTFINMDSKDLDEIARQIEIKRDREAMESIMTDIYKEKDEKCTGE